MRAKIFGQQFFLSKTMDFFVVSQLYSLEYQDEIVVLGVEKFNSRFP